jgi:hypothetical protein
MQWRPISSGHSTNAEWFNPTQFVFLKHKQRD